MSSEVETLIIAGLLHNQDFSAKVFPHVKEKYFETDTHKTFFTLFQDYYEKYSQFPTKEAIVVELENTKGIAEETFKQTKTFAEKVFADTLKASIQKQETQWLLDKAEKYLIDRSCFLAIMDSISIIDGENKKLDRGAIPDIMKEALSISFDTTIGHDYIEDADERFDFYHKVENKINLSLEILNKITNGGPPKKALIVPVAPTGVGKTLYLCNEAAHQLVNGKNVLYITLEMAEERIAERIDANLLDITIQDLKQLPKDSFQKKILNLTKKSCGKLVIKNYPPGTFHANHLRFLLKDLKAKKKMVPDVVIVDYLALMASYRSKNQENTYNYLRLVAEELRGVMVEYDMLGISPNQTNRSGQNSTDIELKEMADSHGISMTADMIFCMISTPELEKIGRILFKQLKNRFGDLNYYHTFQAGITRGKMRLYDVDDSSTQQSSTQQSVTINKPKAQSKGLVF